MQKNDSPLLTEDDYMESVRALSHQRMVEQIHQMSPIQLLFWAGRVDPKNPMNNPNRATGKYIAARIARAKAKRAKGRVRNGIRQQERKTYERSNARYG